jgi:hypothetical protein
MFIVPESPVLLSCFGLNQMLSISLNPKEILGRERVCYKHFAATRRLVVLPISCVRLQ